MTKAKTILVVDDDQVLRQGLRLMLQKQGYNTLEAEDGQEARQLIDGHRPDLVILDMMMPRWGGFAVLEHFQQKADAPPFIMITAHAGEKHRAYATQAGAKDYICKPFSLERLLEGVETAFRDILPTPSQTTEAGGSAPLIRFSCADCGAKIKAPVQLMGQKRPCPRCKKVFVVHWQPPEDEGPAVVLEF